MYILRDLNQLIIYRGILQDELVQKVQRIADLIAKGNKEELNDEYYELCALLLQKVDELSLSTDLWKEYIIHLILQDENIFSLNSERIGENISEDLLKLTEKDLHILKKLYNYDWDWVSNIIGDESKVINNYTHTFVDNNVNKMYISTVKQLKELFSTKISTMGLVKTLNMYYFSTGCGQLCRYVSFRFIPGKGLLGINDVDPITFEDLIGYEYQKNILIKNTDSFLTGKKANNVLLFGDKGTGKSSSVKALGNKYCSKGLRLIELSKDQLTYFPELIKSIRGRGLYFIIFMDDLSFEDFEVEYKHLKAIIEGSLELRPDNVLIYATSNRRHLIKENWSDRENAHGELHMSDTEQEKLSLADRFGISITYGSPNQEEFLQIVEELAKKNMVDLPGDELRNQALKWELWHHGRSGRTASQFITHLLGNKQ
ncbi:hypothetical protein SAMN00017405_1265 [Desulfonispora thiosulfatigenes DSM 11270]|uniref:Uncharacterized protein n=1 Tax=Desulfonispora thiosulfatigenes DSM 11270 TaxID=656914 RepID=A0A1W1V1R2_DESTI|nr:ATP-binding protein [Desulfonispora thiosulfatigenes]SMB87262.1 hypothetical protein SAMN00017405_1265 [Desulfonispora thiosulfatigenes DSM 11270]